MSRNALIWACRQWGHFQLPDGRVEQPKACDIAVLMTLADMADQHSLRCWPSQGHLCHRLGVSKRRLLKSIALWETLGLVVTDHRHGRSGRQQSNNYQVRLDRGKDAAQEQRAPYLPVDNPVENPVDKRVDRGAKRHHGGGSTGGDISHPLESSINHQKEDRSGSAGAQTLNTEKESPTVMPKQAPDGAKEVRQGSKPASRDYLLENLRRVRQKAKV